MPTRPPTQKLPLAATGLEVTPVCVGCAQLGNMPETFGFSVAESQALETIRSSFDGPINFLDTAASYGDGESERRIGLIIAELGGLPEGFVLATKADRDLVSGDFSGEQMKRSIDRSLRLLGLDTLQLVYLHDPEYSSLHHMEADCWPKVASPTHATCTPGPLLMFWREPAGWKTYAAPTKYHWQQWRSNFRSPIPASVLRLSG